jgi:hypothetical protein
MVLMVHSREDSPPEKGTGSVLISESWLLYSSAAAVQLQYAPPKGRWVLNLHIIGRILSSADIVRALDARKRMYAVGESYAR